MLDVLAALVVAAVLLSVGRRIRSRSRRYRQLAQQGIETEAVILGRYRRRLPKTGHRYFVEYAFETAAGARVVRKSPASAGEYQAAEAGRPIAVVYDPREPGFSRPRRFLVDRGYLGRD
jgi:hypothetical protein